MDDLEKHIEERKRKDKKFTPYACFYLSFY